MTLQKIYDTFCAKKSDINEHLPVLKKYADHCDHITEMGVRSVVSTFAFILAKPKKLISIDLFHPAQYGDNYRLDLISTYAKDNNIDFVFCQTGSKTDFIPKLPDFINSPVRCGINFNYVQIGSFSN